MNIRLKSISKVRWIERNRCKFNVYSSWLVRYILRIVYNSLSLGRRATTTTQIRNFIHVQPNSWEFYLIIKVLEHILPKLGCVWMEIVNKNILSRPDLSYHIASFCGLDKQVSLVSLLIRIALFIFDTCFNDGNISVSFCYIPQSIQREFVTVNCKSLEIMHIVNICPNCVKWDSILFIFLKHCLNFSDVSISPATLMETKGPKWRNQGSSYKFMEINKQKFRITISKDEPEVNDSSNSPIDL